MKAISIISAIVLVFGLMSFSSATEIRVYGLVGKDTCEVWLDDEINYVERIAETCCKNLGIPLSRAKVSNGVHWPFNLDAKVRYAGIQNGQRVHVNCS